jgi:hypothetical protein
MLYRKRGRTLSILLGAAGVFVVLFNLRYAVLDGMTYSLSSVTGANELVLYIGITAAIALVIVWVAALVSLNALSRGPGHALEMSLALVWVIIFVLMLPVLVNYSWNGALVAMYLPEFGSSFVGFLSLINILFVGLLGPLLAGLGALSAALYLKKSGKRNEAYLPERQS